MSHNKEDGRSGIALCLSGGGFRAALFHLGAMQRLLELGVLEKVDTISSVSGGSIFSAHLASQMVQREVTCPGDFLDWQVEVAKPFREFVKNDIRTVPFLKNVLWNWLLPGPRVKSLEEAYSKHLTKLKISDLPEKPNFILCASDLTFGVCWEFQRNRVGSYRAGSLDEARGWPLARAIAASSSFPPVFGPMPIRVNHASYKKGDYKGRDRARLLDSLSLSDGGLYDNMALEPVWKTHKHILVSDCGAPFEFKNSPTYIRRLLRYTSLITNQTQALRKRILFSNIREGKYNGAYWSLSSARRDYVNNSSRGYSKSLVEEVISEVRTDLDLFSDAEVAVMENHGYFVADYAVNKRVPELITNASIPLSPPHPDWLCEAKVRTKMKSSHKRFSLPRICQSLFR